MAPTLTTEAPITDVLDAVQAADTALAESERLAEAQRASVAAAKPATRRELLANAKSARTILEARRAVAVEEYALATNSVYAATEAVADAAHAHAQACRAAHHERLALARMRRTIEDSWGVATARERYDRDSTPANRLALIAASDAVQRAMADLPPVPGKFSARAASRAPGVAAGVKADRDAIALDV